MSDGWRSSDGDSHVVAKSPWSNGGHENDVDHNSAITRAGWGDGVAPLARNMPQVQNTLDGPDPNANGTNGQKPWRAGFGGNNVAPGAANMRPVDNTVAQDPNQGNGPSPWRAGFGGSGGVAPGARSMPPIDASSPDRQAPVQAAWKAPDAPVQPGAPNPSPWLSNNPGQQNQQWRAGYPDSTYRGPDAPQAPAQSPGGGTPDWRTYIQQQQQQAQNPQQVMTNGGRSADAPGVPGNPGLNNVSADQRKYIENSLYLKTSVSGYLGTGAITGGAIGAGEWYLDHKLLATVGQPHTGILAWWENHSPILQKQQTLTGRLSEIEASHAAKTADLAVAEDALTTHARNLNEMLGGLNTRVASLAEGTADEAAKQLLQKQQAFVADAALRTNPTALARVIGTPEEVEAGAKLFAHDSVEAKTLLELANASKTKSVADLAVKNTSKELERTQTMLTESVEDGAGSLRGRMFGGAAKGLAIAGGTLAAGYLVDKLGASVFGYKQPEADGIGRFLLDGAVVPGILLSDLPARYKFGLAGSAFLSARVADYFAGTGASTQMSTLLRPNISDGILMTAAAMAPVDGKTKALLVAGAWGIGRVYNEVAHLTGLDGGAPAQLRDNSDNAFNHDQLTRTESTFDNAVEKGKALGKENEATLELQMRDWLGKQGTTNPITHMRGTAVIADALGQFRLEEGSRFDLASHADKKDRILKGQNYDFGGEATTWLRMAAGSLVSAQNFVSSHKGQTVDGQVMDDNYIQQLKNEQTKVEAKLNLVYGAHDVQGVFDELVKQARVNSGDMQQALVRLKNQLDVLNSNDTRFVAKSHRDLAVGYLAEASYMAKSNNGEEARIMYQAAIQYLQNAERLDSNNPDNQALEKIQSTVAQGIPGAISNQYKSNWNNPFQLKTPDYGANLLGK